MHGLTFQADRNMTAIGFALLCVGMVVFFADEYSIRSTISVAARIGALIAILGLGFLLVGIVTFLWRTMP